MKSIFKFCSTLFAKKSYLQYFYFEKKQFAVVIRFGNMALNDMNYAFHMQTWHCLNMQRIYNSRRKQYKVDVVAKSSYCNQSSSASPTKEAIQVSAIFDKAEEIQVKIHFLNSFKGFTTKFVY